MKKFLLSALCAVTAAFGAYAAEQSYTITFTTGTETNASYSAPLSNLIASGNSYVSAVKTNTNVKIKTADGVSIGSNNNPGTLALSLSADGQKKITKVVVKDAKGKSSGCKLNVNESGEQTMTNAADDYTFNINATAAVSELTITASKKSYIKSIVVYYESEEGGSTGGTEEKTLGDIMLNGSPVTDGASIPVTPAKPLNFSCANAVYITVESTDVISVENSEGDNVSCIAPETAGNYVVTVTVMDVQSNIDEVTFNLTVIANDPVSPSNETSLYWNFSGYTGDPTTENGLTLGNKNTDAVGSWVVKGSFAGASSFSNWGTTKDNPRLTIGKTDSAFTGTFTLTNGNIPANATITEVIIGVCGTSRASEVNFSVSVNGTVATETAKWTSTNNDAPQNKSIKPNLIGNNIVLSCANGTNGFGIYDVTVKYTVSTEPEAPAHATIHVFGDPTKEYTNEINLQGQPITIHFAVPEGVDVFYKYDKTSAVSLFAEDGYLPYDKNGQGLIIDGPGSLSHYTVKDNVKSTPKTIAVTGSTSAISEVVAEGAAAKAVYDLQGRRVVNATKGIFIVGGKKVIRK